MTASRAAGPSLFDRVVVIFAFIPSPASSRWWAPAVRRSPTHRTRSCGSWLSRPQRPDPSNTPPHLPRPRSNPSTNGAVQQPTQVQKVDSSRKRRSNLPRVVPTVVAVLGPRN